MTRYFKVISEPTGEYFARFFSEIVRSCRLLRVTTRVVKIMHLLSVARLYEHHPPPTPGERINRKHVRRKLNSTHPVFITSCTQGCLVHNGRKSQTWLVRSLLRNWMNERGRLRRNTYPTSSFQLDQQKAATAFRAVRIYAILVHLPQDQ